MGKHTIEELRQRQALPLEAKIEMSYARVRDWVDAYGIQGVHISFSGGKDSTVLLDLIRNRYGYSDMKAVFVDVPTQYPELKQFVKTFDNVDIIKPKISFMEVCEKYGFPLISKEVSESGEGARKYLKSIISEAQAGGGGKVPYQTTKLLGMGRFAPRTTNNNIEIQLRTREKHKNSDVVGMVLEEQGTTDTGEYP